MMKSLGSGSSQMVVYHCLLWRLLVVITVIFCLFNVSVANARNYQVLALSWLSQDGGLLLNQDLASSFMAIPIAINHFNTRNGSILPFLSEDNLRNCHASLQLINGTLIDDEGLPSVAMSKFVHTLVAEAPIDMIHGPSRSEAAQTVAIAAGTLRIPMISFMPAAAFLNNQDIYPTLYQTVPGDDQFALIMAELLRSYRYRVVGLIHANDASSLSLRDSLVNACGARNIRVRPISFDSTKHGAELELSVRKAFDSLVREKLNVVLRTTRNVEQEISIAKAAVEEQWIQGKLHIGRLSAESLINSARAFKDGDHYLKSFLKGSLNVFASYDLTNSNFVRLKHAWNQFDPNLVNAYLPNGTTSKGYSYKIPHDYFLKRSMPRSFAAAYDSIIALGLAACGPNKDPNSNMKLVHFTGTTGSIRLNQQMVAAFPHQRFEFILESLVENSCPSESCSSMVSKQVGKFIDGNWRIHFDDIIYSDGTNQIPKDKEHPKHIVDTLPFGAKVLGWCESCVTILCCLWAISHLIRNGRKFSPPNQQPSKILFWVIILGSILLALSLIPLTLETSAGCMAYLWLLSLGFSLVVGALICKAIYVLILWRTESALFNRTSRSTLTIIGQRSSTSTTAALSTRSPMTSTLTNMTFNTNKADDVSTVLGVSSKLYTPAKSFKMKIFSPLVLLIFAFVALMITWQVIQPNVYGMVVLFQDMEGNPLFSVMQCTSATSALSHPFTVALIIMTGTIILIAFFLSLCARNAPRELAYDIKATIVAGICILQVFSIALPSLAAAWKTSLGHFLVNSSVSFLVCLIVIFTMFVPKVFNWKLTSFLPIKPMRSSASNNLVNPMATEELNGNANERYLNGHQRTGTKRSSLLLRTAKSGATKHKSNVIVQFDFSPSEYGSSPRAQGHSQQAGTLPVFSDVQDAIMLAHSKFEHDAISTKVSSHLPDLASSPPVRQPNGSNAPSPSRLHLTRAGSNGLDNLDSIISGKRRLPAFVDPNELLMNAATISSPSGVVVVNRLLQRPFPISQGTDEINDLPNFGACGITLPPLVNENVTPESPSNVDAREEDNGLENI